jgi:small subunit ribosomal protein S19
MLFVDPSLIDKVAMSELSHGSEPIQTWSRCSTIALDFIQPAFQLHNGKSFLEISVTENMMGNKSGEFSPSHAFKSHTPHIEQCDRSQSLGKTCTDVK